MIAERTAETMTTSSGFFTRTLLFPELEALEAYCADMGGIE